MVRKEGPRDEAERSDIAKRADVQRGGPSQPVKQPESDKSENEIGDSDTDGLQKGGLCAQTCEFKDARCEVQNRIDAGKLIEEGDQDGEQDRFAKTHRPEM